MRDPILVAVAWPYANSEIHVGNLTGSHLPADVFARFQRLMGMDVRMVSGTDSHGTPVTITADAMSMTPHDVYQKFHAGFLELFQKLGIHYDLFTSTHTTNHEVVSQAMFIGLKEKGYLFTKKEMQWYSTSQNRFLPDRYVEGTCYICGYTEARSDQCDNCGNVLEAAGLIAPRSKVDGSTPELRETEHFYLDLGKLQPEIVAFLKERESYLRPNVVKQSLGQIGAEDLRGRPITRDLDWGVPVPLEGWEGKCLYVWFEAVIGYLSATIEWAQLFGEAEDWRKWWHNDASKTYHFIGKDNIVFHAIFWPGQLMGIGTRFDELFGSQPPANLNLPYDIPANEFLNLEGKKISGSRNWAVWGRDFLTRYDPDPLRYYLTVNMPEAKDTDWEWEGFLRRNNDELVATWGNLVNRVLSFTHKHWQGVVPEPGTLTELDTALLKTIEDGFETVAGEYNAVHLRAALSETMRLAAEVNKYLDQTAPWALVKTDKGAAGRAIYTAINAINSLKIMFSPVLPFTSEALHKMLGYETSIYGTQEIVRANDALGYHDVLTYRSTGRDAEGKQWQTEAVEAGRKLGEVQPLFKKLDASIVEEELARLG